MFKISVEHTEQNEGHYFYLYPFWGQFQEDSKEVLCVHRVKLFLENLAN
jgi:hypothetical protein